MSLEPPRGIAGFEAAHTRSGSAAPPRLMSTNSGRRTPTQNCKPTSLSRPPFTRSRKQETRRQRQKANFALLHRNLALQRPKSADLAP
jgi:hypothetical protein